MSTEESYIPRIDHEQIRDVGQVMAQHLGALAAEEVDREVALKSLNECVDSVPFTDLFDEDYLVARSLRDVSDQIRAIDDELRDEYSRLDTMLETLRDQAPKQVTTATHLADIKKEKAQDAADAKKTPLKSSREELFLESAELGISIDAIGMAWPLPPFSKEVLEAVASEQANYEATEAEIDDDLEGSVRQIPKYEASHIGLRHTVLPSKKEVEVERVLGPHAELADKITPLSEQLVHSESEHSHVYGKVVTAKEVYESALQKDPKDRTEEEDSIVKVLYVLQRRFLMNPNNLDFLEVYEVSDLMELNKRLRDFSRKDRPDFKDLEGKILDRASIGLHLLGRDIPEDLRNAQKRMNAEADGRRGMRWSTLTKFAERAVDTMRQSLFAGGTKNVHRKNYVIDIADKTGNKPGLSWVLQFVADDFAMDVLGRRRSEAQVTNKSSFEANCDIIEQWQADNQGLLEALPKDFRLRRHNKQKHNFGFKPRQLTIFENVSAYTSILNMIDDIMIRKNGTGDSKTPRHKPVNLDPQGALSHQLRLGHLIDSLKDELAIYDAPKAGRTEEIKPFEI